MPRKAQPERRGDGPYRCHFCPATLSDKASPKARAWDWVTGYLPATEHCCPKCVKTNNAMWREIVRRSQEPKEPPHA